MPRAGRLNLHGLKKFQGDWQAVSAELDPDQPFLSSLQELLDLPQNSSEHDWCKAAGLGVLLAGVIGGEEARKACRENVTRAVGEFICGTRWNQPLPLQEIKISVERDASEGKNRARLDEFQFAFEIGQAVADFYGQRLVSWRRAADRGGNQRALENKTIIGAFRLRLIRETGAMELRVQEIAGAVSGEHAPGPIGAMRGGRQSDDDEGGFEITKGRNRASPVGPIAIRTALGSRDFLAVTHQAGTLAAFRDLAFEFDKRFLCHRASEMNGPFRPHNRS